jgi:hypothetical protein
MISKAYLCCELKTGQGLLEMTLHRRHIDEPAMSVSIPFVSSSKHPSTYMSVFEFPPRLYCNKCVNLLFLYGT